jgi:hypothetical protein
MVVMADAPCLLFLAIFCALQLSALPACKRNCQHALLLRWSVLATGLQLLPCRMASRCFWDDETDQYAFDSFKNVSLGIMALSSAQCWHAWSVCQGLQNTPRSWQISVVAESMSAC